MQKYENGHFYKIFRPFLSSACMQNVFYKEYRSIWNLQKKSLAGGEGFLFEYGNRKKNDKTMLKKPGSLKTKQKLAGGTELKVACRENLYDVLFLQNTK